jgi:hypothetical protein
VAIPGSGQLLPPTIQQAGADASATRNIRPVGVRLVQRQNSAHLLRSRPIPTLFLRRDDFDGCHRAGSMPTREAVSAMSRDGGRRCPSEAYIQEASGLYEPSIRANHLAPVSGSRMGRLMPWPFTSRMTVVQLASGDLFLHSPIAFDVPLQLIFRRWAGSATSFPPTGATMRISGSGRGRFWRQPPGPRLASASERALSGSTCNSTAISIASPASTSARVFWGRLSTLRVLP